MCHMRTFWIGIACLGVLACGSKQELEPATDAVEPGTSDADGDSGTEGGNGASGTAGTDGGGDGAGGSDAGGSAGTGSAGEGGPDTGATGDGSGADGSEAPDHVVTTDNDTDVFQPADLVISAGDTVRFEMTSRHNAVQVSEEVYQDRRVEPLEGGFVVWFGQTEDILFSDPGVYYYICEPHVVMDMVGTITVE